MQLIALRQSSTQSSAASAAHLNGHQVEEDATSTEALMSRLSEMEEQVRQLNEANRTLGKRNEDLECEVSDLQVLKSFGACNVHGLIKKIETP